MNRDQKSAVRVINTIAVIYLLLLLMFSPSIIQSLRTGYRYWNFYTVNYMFFLPAGLLISSLGLLVKKNWARVLSITLIFYWLICFLYGLYDWIFVNKTRLASETYKGTFMWGEDWLLVVLGLMPAVLLYFLFHPNVKEQFR